MTRWNILPSSPDTAVKLGKLLNINPIVAQIILNRGIHSISKAKEFIGRQETDATQTFCKESLKKLYDLIQDCIHHQKPILLYGDYDVDGMTSTALMIQSLKKMGAIVHYIIPSRFTDGYGLHSRLIQTLQDQNIGLLITLDCGISNYQEIHSIKQETSASVAILDHHTLPDKLPQADVIINPKFLTPDHPLYGLCTVGIVYYVMKTFYDMDQQALPKEWLALVALGTIADVASLTGINRDYVRQGLFYLSKTPPLGIQALLKEAGHQQPVVSIRDIGFVIAPRLNASGRLAHAGIGVELLLAEDTEKAEQIAKKLELLNQDRRQIDASIFLEAKEKLKNHMDYPIIALSGHHWHPGVIGITASKLTEAFKKPTVIITEEGPIARGSARSIGAVNIFSILGQCSEFFSSFGGHKEAAGFSIDRQHIQSFIDALYHISKQAIQPDDLIPSLTIDFELKAPQISLDFIHELSQLGPFGQHNPEPVFYTEDLIPLQAKTVGNGHHLKVTFSDKNKNKIFDGIGFNLGHRVSDFYKTHHKIAFHLTCNDWMGKKNAQLQILDVQ